MQPDGLSLSDVEAAERRIRPHVLETPLVPFADDGVHLKLENLQRTGSFKLRGAVNAIEQLSDAELRRGVSTVSAGNHGLAVAWAARRRGAHATVYVSENAVERKVAAMQAAGAKVVKQPLAKLQEFLLRTDAGDGAYFLPPFADVRIAAGQGTVGLEIRRRLPDVQTVLVPVGGGGLALGVSTALPGVRVHGVTAEKAPAVAQAWRTGRASPVAVSSLADGLNAPLADLRTVNSLKERLAGLLTVTDDQIREAMRVLLVEAKTVAEGAGAAAFAAIEAHPELRRPLAVVVSGGNVDPRLLAETLTAPVAARPA
jgi:threonine dehydratase